MFLSNIYTRVRGYLLHLGVSLTLLFIILCACILWVIPSQSWQLGLVISSGLIVIISSLFLFYLSTKDKRPPIDANQNAVVRYVSPRELFNKYDVNHRNTAFVIIITVPLLMGLYSGLWWRQMQTYVIQTTTAPLVCTTRAQFHPLQ
jgi:hypothetical protein